MDCETIGDVGVDGVAIAEEEVDGETSDDEEI